MSWLGNLVGTVAAAPFRVVRVVEKVAEASLGDHANMPSALEDMADAAEEAAKKVVDGKAKG
jgi:hypothetical protein